MPTLDKVPSFKFKEIDLKNAKEQLLADPNAKSALQDSKVAKFLEGIDKTKLEPLTADLPEFHAIAKKKSLASVLMGKVMKLFRR